MSACSCSTSTEMSDYDRNGPGCGFYFPDLFDNIRTQIGYGQPTRWCLLTFECLYKDDFEQEKQSLRRQVEYCFT